MLMSLMVRLATCPKTQLLLCAGMAALGPSVATHLGLSGALTAALGPALSGLALQGGVVAASALGEFIGGRAEATFEQFQQGRAEHRVQQTLSGAVGATLADLIREFSHDHAEQKVLQQLAGSAAERWMRLPSPPLADEATARAFAEAGPLTEDSLLARVDWSQITRFLCRDTSGSGPSTGISLRLAVGAGTADALASYFASHFHKVLRTTLLRSATGDTGAWRQTVLYLLAELMQNGGTGGVSKADLSAAIEAQFAQLPAKLLAEMIPLIVSLKQDNIVLGEKLEKLTQAVETNNEFQESLRTSFESALKEQSRFHIAEVTQLREQLKTKDVQIATKDAQLSDALRALAAVSAFAQSVPPTADYFTRGLQAQATGDFPKAAQHFQRAIGEKVVPAIRVYLAQMRMAAHLGNLIEAGDWAEKAAQVCPDEPDWLDEIAVLLYVTGRYQAALRPAFRVAELRVKAKGWRNPDTLTSMGNLAETYSVLGENNKAKELQEKTLEVRRRVLGEEHPDTLTSMNNLASTYSALGENNKAKELEEKTLEVRRRVLGEEHPDTLKSMNNLAVTYGALGQHERAKELLELAYRGRYKILGPSHPDTIQAKENLDACLAALAGTFGGAESVEETEPPVSVHEAFFPKAEKAKPGTYKISWGTKKSE
jgi:tetratricopeptide (TPR) repeat protein